jgi:2-polyprenyl-3-methyl-5-hydroxy-6-metoxy-1,4-benzoquinol methylase
LRGVRRNANLDGIRLGDFGCGYDATMTRSMLGRVSSALLVDLYIAPDLKQHHQVTAIEGRIEDVAGDLESGSLDVVLCLAVLEHLWEREATLREFRRLLAPGGVLLVSVPSWQAKRVLEFSAYRRGILSAEEMDDHKRYFGPRDLWPMLVDAGFAPSAIRCRRRSFGFVTFAACHAPGDE